MRKTELFSQLDNVIGNYMDGDATELDIVNVAVEVNRYLIKHEHPHDIDASLFESDERTYQKIKEEEGTRMAINQALQDCLKGKITGGDFLDIMDEVLDTKK